MAMDLNKKQEKKELLEKRKTGEYRKVAEAIIKRFGIKNPETMDDERLLKEFSRMSHPNAIFNASTSYPSGNLIKTDYTTRTDGIIWATWFAPDFVKAIIPDREFKEIWERERKKKVKDEGNLKNSISTEKILDQILEKDSEFLTTKDEDEQRINIININKLFEIIGEVYNKELEETIGYVIPTPLDILNIFTQTWGFDSFVDFLALTEQEITLENEKLTYVKITDEEMTTIDDLINEFEEETFEEEVEEEEFEEEEEFDTDSLFGDD